MATVEAVSEPLSTTTMDPPFSCTPVAVTPEPSESDPAFDFKRFEAVSEPPASDAVPASWLTVSVSAEIPSGRIVIVAAVSMVPLSPPAKNVLSDPVVQLFVE